MNLEIETTKTETIKVTFETPAYYRSAYREIKITEDKIIEVNDQICIIHERRNQFSSYNEKCVQAFKNDEKSTPNSFNDMLQTFFNNVQGDKIQTELQSLTKATA